MNHAIKERAEALFLELVEADRGSWQRLLGERCNGDEELRKEVESLLGFHGEAGSFLDHQALLALTPDLVRASDTPLLPGTRLGEYTIERMVGSGGMGVVYQARQERPRRQVALKLVNAAIASPSLLRRFELEAEVLGRLQHPGIAQIFEAGAAVPQGVAEVLPKPFIAMEFVDGPTLLEFARQRGLDARGKIELVIRVCQAVQHAHQRGVIHRDLKPANILVDGSGQPKILDFGVARAAGAGLHLTTMQTGIGQLIGTLAYMSPEQVLADPAEIDTRSDVYALGVILFELLTGKLPLDVAGQALPEAVRAIRQDDPQRLSTIDRFFRGELDTIVSKALEKDKARRYQSASDLGDDLGRYLAGEPIHAKEDSAFYVLRKQLRRHRWAVAAAATFVVGVMLFALYAVWQGGVERRLARAERVARVEADLARDLARNQAEELRRNLYVSAIGFAQAALVGNDIGRVRRLLDSCPEDLRGWEWNYLRTMSDMSDRVTALPPGSPLPTITPDARWIVLIAEKTPLRIVDGASGEIIREVELGLENIVTCRISADGRTVVAGGANGSLYVIECNTGNWVCHELAQGTSVSALAVTHDGSRAIVALIEPNREPRCVEIELDSGITRREFFHQRGQSIADYSPDGSLVALGDLGGGVRVYKEDEHEGIEIANTGGFVRWVRFNRSGSKLACTGIDGVAHLCDLTSGVVSRVKVFINKIWCIAWSPDDRHLAICGTEALIRVMDVSTFSFVAQHLGHETTIDGLEWHPDGHLLSTSRDRTIRWWNRPLRPDRLIAMDQGFPQMGRWSHDGRSFYIGFVGGEIREYDPATLSVRRVLFRSGEAITCIALSPSSAEVMVGTVLGSCFVIETATGRELSRFRSPSGRALTGSFSPDGSRLALGSDHRAVTLWDPRTGTLLQQFPMLSTSAIRAEYSPDGKLIAAAYYDHAVRLHDAVTGQVLREMRGPTDWCAPLRFTADGSTLIAPCADSKIFVWDTRTPGEPKILIGHQNAVYSAAPSPDGTRLVSGGWDNTVRLWDLKSGLELLTWRPHLSANWITEFAPDGRRMITGSHDQAILLWDSEPRQVEALRSPSAFAVTIDTSNRTVN